MLIGGYHYCGPGQDTGNPKPIDILDAACKVHDACYNNVGISAFHGALQYLFGLKSKASIQCEKDKCDEALCNAARSFTPYDYKSSFMRYIVMDVFCW
ncbi:MAG TPA: hypothetical protein DDW31_02980 [candidate division Zixibacteria bacterium]|nr:hypothetical protein [candidate division Zixibacteria bacterium]